MKRLILFILLLIPFVGESITIKSYDNSHFIVYNTLDTVICPKYNASLTFSGSTLVTINTEFVNWQDEVITSIKNGDNGNTPFASKQALIDYFQTLLSDTGGTTSTTYSAGKWILFGSGVGDVTVINADSISLDSMYTGIIGTAITKNTTAIAYSFPITNCIIEVSYKAVRASDGAIGVGKMFYSIDGSTSASSDIVSPQGGLAALVSVNITTSGGNILVRVSDIDPTSSKNWKTITRIMRL